jgi:hypothetical protein
VGRLRQLPLVNQAVALGTLANPQIDLADAGSFLGAGASDRRAHPYFRTEWLQKMMNLTTVRTHQFAVWITVGFFEVTRRGQARTSTPDQFGQEVADAQNRKVRYRGFFIVDRTRATGFNPADPGGARELVTYRRRIQ